MEDIRGFAGCESADDRRQPYTLNAPGRQDFEEQLSELNEMVKAGLKRLRHA